MADKLTSLKGFGEGDPKPEKMDKNKRWGNSAIRGVGVNSPAMMQARAGFEKAAKSKALGKKTGKLNFAEWARKSKYDSKHKRDSNSPAGIYQAKGSHFIKAGKDTSVRKGNHWD